MQSTSAKYYFLNSSKKKTTPGSSRSSNSEHFDFQYSLHSDGEETGINTSLLYNLSQPHTWHDKQSKVTYNVKCILMLLCRKLIPCYGYSMPKLFSEPGKVFVFQPSLETLKEKKRQLCCFCDRSGCERTQTFVQSSQPETTLCEHPSMDGHQQEQNKQKEDTFSHQGRHKMTVVSRH